MTTKDTMNDVNLFIDTINKFGIPIKCNNDSKGITIEIQNFGANLDGKDTGYNGFMQTWYFDIDGRFIGCGSYE